jgi:hypothetical protein
MVKGAGVSHNIIAVGKSKKINLRKEGMQYFTIYPNAQTRNKNDAGFLIEH